MCRNSPNILCSKHHFSRWQLFHKWSKLPQIWVKSRSMHSRGLKINKSLTQVSQKVPQTLYFSRKVHVVAVPSRKFAVWPQLPVLTSRQQRITARGGIEAPTSRKHVSGGNLQPGSLYFALLAVLAHLCSTLSCLTLKSTFVGRIEFSYKLCSFPSAQAFFSCAPHFWHPFQRGTDSWLSPIPPPPPPP